MIDIDIVLLILKISILVLLYLFIWRVVRAALGDVKGGVAAVAPAPDVVLPAAGQPPAVFSPEDRQTRRDQRVSERTMSGESSDFGSHIHPRLVVEQSSIVPVGVMFPLAGWVTVGRAPTSNTVARRDVRLGSPCPSAASWAVLLRRGSRQHQRHLRQWQASDGRAAQVREPAAHRRDRLPLRGVSAR